MSAESKKKNSEYLKKYRKAKGRSRFLIDILDNNSIIQEKFENAKRLIGSNNVPISNGETLTKLLDYFLRDSADKKDHLSPEETGQSNQPTFSEWSNYSLVPRSDVDQQLFVTTIGMTVNMVNTVSSHIRRNQQCRGAVFTGNISYMKGHCAVVSYTCGHCQLDLPNWQSSPYLPNQKFLVNYRMAHGFYSSGILPSQYERFMEAANIGCMNDKYLKNNFSGLAPSYLTATHDEYGDSCRMSLLMEVGLSQITAEN